MPQSDPKDRRVVEKQIALGVVTTALVFGGGYFLLPIPVPPDAGLVWVLRWQTLPIFTFLCVLMKVASTRLHTTAIDPINGQCSVHFQVDCKVLQNTLEQLVLHLTGQLLLSTYLRGQQLRLVPIAALFFVFGRLAFWWGYRQHHLQRAFGMACTSLPTMATHLGLVVLFLASLLY